jgi:hypothetical protein
MDNFAGRSSGTEESLNVVISISLQIQLRQDQIAGHDDAHWKAWPDAERWLNVEIALDDLLPV